MCIFIVFIIHVRNYANRTKNNTGFVTPSHGLFLTCRGKNKYTVLYNTIQQTAFAVGLLNAKNPLLAVVATSVCM